MTRFLVLLFVFWSTEALAKSLWEHNGSAVSLEADGQFRRFHYDTPRIGLSVEPGTLLFHGLRRGSSYIGTAYVFSETCGSIGYPVMGPVSADQRKITLFGEAPVRDADCKIVRFRTDGLVFTYRRTVAESAEPEDQVEPESPEAEVSRRYQSVCFELHKSGSFFGKTIKEALTSEEGKAVLKGICTYFTGDAQGCSSGVETAGQVYAAIYRKEGNEWRGTIDASPGYEICRAHFVTNDFSATSDTDTSMTLDQSRSKLDWYAAIGESERQGRWVRYQVVLEEVPQGRATNDCYKPGVLWFTKDRASTPRDESAKISLEQNDLWCTRK
jgi:hypothetical protein